MNTTTLLGRNRDAHRGFFLVGSSIQSAILSPYFQPTETRKEAPARDISLSLGTMNLKARVTNYSTGSMAPQVNVHLQSDDGSVKAGVILPLAPLYSDDEAVIRSNINGIITTFCTNISLPAPTIEWLASTPTDVAAYVAAAITAAAPAASALSLSLQTSTGAVGTQVSTTRNAYVMLNGSVSTTATIGGASSGDIILEVCPTNSATAGDWVEWGRIGNSQTISLAIVLNSVQVTKGMAVAFVPAGYYVKARQAGSGTVSYTLTNAKQILI